MTYNQIPYNYTVEVTNRFKGLDRINRETPKDSHQKEGKTTRPFSYDLNQIPYNYTVEMTNRFKGLDLIDRMHEELWTEVCDIVQEAVIKTSRKRNAKRQHACLRRSYK